MTVAQQRPVVRRGGEWPIATVVLAVLVALVVVLVGPFRVGLVVLAGAIVLAFFLRLLLPTATAGMLAVRSRGVDLLVLGLLGGTMTVLTFWIPA